MCRKELLGIDSELFQPSTERRQQKRQKASGIAVEQTELDVLLEEISEREKLAEEEGAGEKKKAEDEKLKVADIRQTAMESLAERKKRKIGEDTVSTKSRKSVSTVIDFLREKGQQQLLLKEQEIELKKQQQELESHKNATEVEKHESMMQMMPSSINRCNNRCNNSSNNNKNR